MIAWELESTSMIPFMKRHLFAFIGITSIFIVGIIWGAMGVSQIGLPFGSATPCPNCNIIVISIDTLRADHLPCYGYIRNTMPNICRFANRNIIFSNAFSQSTWTFPNEISMFTSLYLSNHSMDNTVSHALHPSITTLTQQLKHAGYQTELISNARDQDLPLTAGLGRGFDTITSTQRLNISDQIETWKASIERIKNRRPADPPVFLFLYTIYIADYRGADIGFVDTFLFDPYFQPPVISGLHSFTQKTHKDAKEIIGYNLYRGVGSTSQKIYQEVLTTLNQTASLPAAQKAFERLDPYDQKLIYALRIHDALDMSNPSHQRYVQNLYDNRLFQLDQHLGSVFDLLNDRSFHQNTIVVVTSDHGENLGDHGLLGHATQPFDTVTHVPLILRVPGVTDKIITHINQLVDLFPTLLRLTGFATPKSIAGSDRTPLLLGPIDKPNESTFAISELNDGEDQSIRTNQWRLVTLRSGPNTTESVQLYYLPSDPGETKNVASDYPQIVEQLHTMLIDAIRKLPTYPQ